MNVFIAYESAASGSENIYKVDKCLYLYKHRILLNGLLILWQTVFTAICHKNDE